MSKDRIVMDNMFLRANLAKSNFPFFDDRDFIPETYKALETRRYIAFLMNLKEGTLNHGDFLYLAAKRNNNVMPLAVEHTNNSGIMSLIKLEEGWFGKIKLGYKVLEEIIKKEYRVDPRPKEVPFGIFRQLR